MKEDIFYEREKAKYANPIASREFILSLINKRKYPCHFDYLLKELKLKPYDCRSLDYRLRAMVREGQLKKDDNFYSLPNCTLLVQQGTICYDLELNKFGFHTAKGDMHFLTENCYKSVFQGDVVEVCLMGHSTTGVVWKVNKVISRAHKTFFGHFIIKDGVECIEPVNKEAHSFFILLPTKTKLSPNQLVEVVVVIYPSIHNNCVVKLKKVINLGDNYEQLTDTFCNLLMKKYSLNMSSEFPTSRIKIPSKPKGRVDLSGNCFVTIDSHDTQDIDDAVYGECIKDGKFRLQVAIADVSHYVRSGSDLDKFAEKNACSLYFPHKTVHMLPKKLSTDLCSLKPNEEKLVMVCDMVINKAGKVESCDVYEATAKIWAQLTYDTVNDIISKKEHHDARVQEHIELLHKIYKSINRDMLRSGYVGFNRSDVRINFKNGSPSDISHFSPTLADRMIEAFMVKANEQVSKFLHSRSLPCIYRVNAKPDKEKCLFLQRCFTSMGLKNVSLNNISKSYQKFLHHYKSHKDIGIFTILMLKSMKMAYYSYENTGHFGLGLKYYSHFTSPIRRYADLAVHRILKNYLHNKPQVDLSYAKYISRQCSLKSKYADWAMSDMVKFHKCNLLKKVADKKIYAVYLFRHQDGRAFLQLQKYHIDGYIEYLGKKKYNQGQILQVRILEINAFTGMLKLELA